MAFGPDGKKIRCGRKLADRTLRDKKVKI